MDELLQLITDAFGENTESSDKVKNAVSGAFQKQKDTIYSKDQENLKLKSKWKDAGYDKDKHPTYDDFVNDIKQTQTKAQETELTLNGVNEKLNGYESQLEKALAQVNTLVGEKQAVEKKAIHSTLSDRLNGKVYGHEGQVDSIMYRHSDDIKIDGDNILIGDVGVDEFVNKFIEDNKGIQIQEQKPGNETVGGDMGSATDSDDIIEKMKQQMSR